ncbi:MAG: D-alanyl-D-alanine carboxypeptidase/D-alanyl-D-alanine-endopeptidase [Actinomycetota bacterium]
MRLRRATAVGLVMAMASAAPAGARSGWRARVDALIGARRISVAVADDGASLYRHRARRLRIPASNEKLLLSMALFDELPPATTLATTAAAPAALGLLPPGGVLEGNLWILGGGDPSLGGARHDLGLPFAATRLGALARRIETAGITRIEGRIKGSTAPFGRDWFAPGWQWDFPGRYVAFPTALSYNGNVRRGRHVDDPELRTARALTRKLEALGVPVAGAPGAGAPRKRLTPVAEVRSAELSTLLRYTNRSSSNFFAEVLGKLLGRLATGETGTIARGAAAIERWAGGAGVSVDAYDSSGLSYRNLVSAEGMADLLAHAEQQSWGDVLRRTLPGGGQGTLEDRLEGRVRLRAKTGTLDRVSSLSGWVWLTRSSTWGEFAILSRGMTKEAASEVEDRIVRILYRGAR